MASVSAQVRITANPETVWRVMTDPSQFSAWLDTHQGFVGEPPTAMAPGLAYGQRVKVMGMPAEVKWTVVGFEEQRRLVLEGVGPMGIALSATHELQPEDDAAVVSVTYEFKGAAVFAVAGQLTRDVGESVTKSLAALKALIEN
ncbi:MAG: SRPBCC family protein [Kineosporiaceae bacterium]|nr:SRPBCC family protein [Kineosporiaceae bacterium]